MKIFLRKLVARLLTKYKAFTEDQLAKIEEIEEKVVAGEIKVDSAIGMSTEDLDKIRNAVKP